MNSKNWMLWHAASCCGMLPNPYVQLKKTGAAACCGCTCLRPSLASPLLPALRCTVVRGGALCLRCLVRRWFLAAVPQGCVAGVVLLHGCGLGSGFWCLLQAGSAVWVRVRVRVFVCLWVSVPGLVCGVGQGPGWGVCRRVRASGLVSGGGFGMVHDAWRSELQAPSPQHYRLLSNVPHVMCLIGCAAAPEMRHVGPTGTNTSWIRSKNCP